MSITRRNTLALIAGMLMVATAKPSFAAEQTINVSLWDKGANSMGMLGKGEMMGMGMMGANMMMATMGITADVTEVAAGEITFKAINDSKDTLSLIHI